MTSRLCFCPKALIAAYEATKDAKFLDRAVTVADNCCNRQAGMCKGLVWEHYNEDWDDDSFFHIFKTTFSRNRFFWNNRKCQL